MTLIDSNDFQNFALTIATTFFVLFVIWVFWFASKMD